MYRLSRISGALVLAFAACGPDKAPACRNTGPHPTFVVIVTLPGHRLPADTTLTVFYGGNPNGERYQLSNPNPRDRQVVFCEPSTPLGVVVGPSDAGTDASSDGADAGPATTPEALRCELFTDGPAEIQITSAAIAQLADPIALNVHDDVCVFYQTIELTPRDGG